MRFLSRSLVALAVLWLAYAASPYWALYDLSGAIQARDVEDVTRRVNFRALRISLAKQLVTSYLAAAKRGEVKGQNEVAALGTSVADPILMHLVTPQAVIDILNDGWPESLIGPESPATTTSVVRLRSLGTVWRFFVNSESRGFTRIFFTLPPDAPAPQQFRLELRLDGTWRWRVTGIELPAKLKERLTQELIRRLQET